LNGSGASLPLVEDRDGIGVGLNADQFGPIDAEAAQPADIDDALRGDHDLTRVQRGDHVLLHGVPGERAHAVADSVWPRGMLKTPAST